MKLTQRDFGNGTTLFSLLNDNGIKLDVTDFGARIVNLIVPTETENRNIVLGFESAQEYINQDSYIGATIGRVAGRIQSGQFELDGQTYQVQINTPTGNTLHGGSPGFESKIWQTQTVITDNQISVIFSLTSPDGENGFPGNLVASVTYSLNNQNEWRLHYRAKTDKATLYNPTNHVYFNLTGDPEQTLDDHYLTVAADTFAVLNPDSTVTGEKRAVDGTAFDLKKKKQLKTCFGYDDKKDRVTGIDHPFFLTHQDEIDALLESPDKKMSIAVKTDRDAIVIFTANFAEGKRIIRGKELVNQGGITFETQAAPGAIEFSDFGDIILRPDQEFLAQTIYKITF